MLKAGSLAIISLLLSTNLFGETPASQSALGAAAAPSGVTTVDLTALSTQAMVSAPTATDNRIDPFATYVYRVRAVRGTALSAPSKK